MSERELPFSQRWGYEKPELQFKEINQNLRNSLWSSFYFHFFQDIEEPYYDDFDHFFKTIWTKFFKHKLDEYPSIIFTPSNIKENIRPIKGLFDSEEWYKIYDFLEFVLNMLGHEEGFVDKLKRPFKEDVNNDLEFNLSAYRIINDKLEPISNKEEINELNRTEKLSKKNSLNNVKNHWEKALECFAQKPKPDIPNTIKESISMIESLVKVIEPKANGLGDALSKLEKHGQMEIHQALKKGFSNIYGYTSDSDGIRHALGFDEKSDLDIEDARYFLVSCSAFTNYLIEKARKQGILDD